MVSRSGTYPESPSAVRRLVISPTAHICTLTDPK
nr:MAG TPA: hypothetical protein [Caudoviricetes sp.]